MARGVNKVILIGNLGNDPETEYMPSGNAVTNITVATSESWKDKRFPIGVRPYSVWEYARLQGVEDWFKFECNDTAAYRGIGNGISEPVGHWIGTEVKRYFNGSAA